MANDAAPDPDAWLDEARERVDGTDLGPQVEQVGRVEEVADGIAFVSGLPNAKLDELLHFSGGQYRLRSGPRPRPHRLRAAR